MGLDAQIRALRQPVRPLVVVKYLARLSLIAGLLGLVPLSLCLGLGEWALAGRWAIAILLLVLPDPALRRLPARNALATNEALVILALAYLLIGLLVACSEPIEMGGDSAIHFDLEQLNAEGLQGPPDGLRALHYEFCLPELETLGVPRRKIRQEMYGAPPQIWQYPGWPSQVGRDAVFSLKIKNGKELQVPATEPLE